MLTRRPHTAQFQLMIPFPGTPYHEELSRSGRIKDGRPDCPGLSADQMEAEAKRAYRRFYISLPFLLQILAHPWEQLFTRLMIYARAVPSVFFGKYSR